MSLESARMTRAMFAQLDDGFAQLDIALEKMGLSDETLPQFKIMCDPKSAVEFFHYPKAEYRQIKVFVISEFASRICLAMRSTEFIEDE